jgi:hypothetical protein
MHRNDEFPNTTLKTFVTGSCDSPLCLALSNKHLHQDRSAQSGK